MTSVASVAPVAKTKSVVRDAKSLKAKSSITKTKPYANVGQVKNATVRLPAGPLTPIQVKAAYTNATGSTADGTGMKIAIIGAYNNPYIQSDLNTFCTQFGLPAKTLVVHSMNANAPYDDGWATETNLDTQYATLMAPNASIYIVFAASDSLSDLKAAIAYAKTSINPTFITMSWGIDESDLVGSGLQNYFESEFSSTGSTLYLASAGDGLSVSYPSSSNNVIAVGGTTLDMNGNTPAGEYVWASSSDDDGTGLGISLFYTKPAYQATSNANANKMTPDISLVADSQGDYGVWIVHRNTYVAVAGTSLSSPLFAGILASTFSARVSKRSPTLTTTSLMTKLYSNINPNLPTAPLAGIGRATQGFISYGATM
jgi:subtilase family serine protease